MARRRALSLLAAAALILTQAVGPAAASGNRGAPAGASAGAPLAAGLLDELRSGDRTSFVVEFAARADLRGAGQLKDKAAKASYVLDRLSRTATASQAEALKLAHGLKGLTATGYWLTNVIVVRADLARGGRPDRVTAARLADLAEKLARVHGVSAVRAEKSYPLVEPVDSAVAPTAAAIGLAPEWGIEKVRAPEAWAEGITGSGVVVASIDTGVDYTHEALVEHYRGNLGGGDFDHAYNWWDPTGVCGDAPCDNVGHGTHTMGTIVGGDLDGPLPDVGMAPGARWISAKGCEDIFCSEGSLLSAGQFMIAPTDLNGGNPDPSRAPDLVSNSWGNDNPDDTFYLETVQAWRAAGIIPVFAAGNAGPGCSTAGTPGNYTEVISAGATDIEDTIAEFSSRGPSPTDKISPNLSAPGVDVVSSVPGGGYEAFSGTSMATPHVAGAIALMISSKLAIAGDFDAILNALSLTAVDRPDDQCGSPDADLDPNFVYGEGRLDAKAAVDLVKSGGTLVGTITDAATGDPIAGATVTADDGERQFSTTTAGDGTYDLFLAAGTYSVSASAFGYAVAAVFGTVIETDQTTTEDLALTALPRFVVSGTVSSAESGAPIADATVVALGTPVPAAATDASGHYAITLPIGDYSLRASLGGCTDDAVADIASTGDDVSQDFALTRKLDVFGHGCRPIAFDWVDAGTQSALFGDEFAGRLRLPFSFPFYGASYDALFISDNGYVNFLGPDQFNGFPVGIPSATPPNAAIYAFWQDLYLDAQSEIDYATVGEGEGAAFVLEYRGVRAFGSSARLSFEVKLWADGTIDLLYGDNARNPGDGRNALVGVEDATGHDALQIAFFDRLIAPNSAIRIEKLPVGVVTGVVSDANDGEGIPNAAVTSVPGARTATTDATGHYELRLLAGAYELTASHGTYNPATASVSIAAGDSATVDFSLEAPTAAVDTDAVSASVELGESAQSTIRLSNDGSAMLEWTARELDQGVIPPDLPPAIAGVFRSPVWHAVPLPAGATVAPTRPFAVGGLPIIIEDPADDSLDSNELTIVRGQSDGAQMDLALEFAPGTPMNEIGGVIHFDVDQDPATGLPPEALFGKPGQDIGFDAFATLFDLSSGVVPVFDLDGNLIALAPATVEGTTVSFAVPLDAFGGDDGNVDLTMVVGFFGPSDWAPDEGHGTVAAFSDVPWIAESPDSGSIGTGGFDEVIVTLGAPSLPPGEYHGQVVFVSNAPKQSRLVVDVTLTVLLPDAFGRLAGTVADAHTGAPIGSASVTLHSTWLGGALDVETTTATDGSFSLIGPEGTWPLDVHADGYVDASMNAAIVRGVSTGGADVALHRIQPHGSVEGGPFTFILTPDRSGHATIVISNPGGHAALTYEVHERMVGATVGGHAAPAAPVSVGTSSAAPAGHVARQVLPAAADGTSLVLEDTLPWDSDAIQQVLAANGVTFDVAGSKDLATIDFSAYNVIYVGNDQPQTFYDAVSANLDRLAAYVAAGGYLWFGSAAFGFQDGNLDGFVLPGGLTIHGPAYEDVNTVAAPDHPLMAGMPNPFTGTSASHVTFGDLPTGATVIARGQGSGEPTLVEYDLGVGRVLAVGQTVEFAWARDQDGRLILENGVPYTQAFIPFSDVPWLSTSPTSGSIAPDGGEAIAVDVDTTGLEPGLYQAAIVITTNDPDLGSVQIPVTLVVPAYQQGINAGGGTYVNANGDTWAADRAFTTGGFGWAGTSSTRSTPSPIAGTDDDPLFSDLRLGMTAYRFSLPDGVYRVDLSFAELQLHHAGDRVFDVRIEGVLVLPGFDVFAEAGGQRVALERSFLVTVTDGVLDVTFVAQRGDQPIVNAILVTELPEGAPGR